MLLLGCRLLVPFLSIGQAIAVTRTLRSNDKTWVRSIQVVWEMIVVFFSVLCSVVPRTQKFWAGLQTRRAHVEDRDGTELSSMGGGNSGNRYLSGPSKGRSQPQRSKERKSIHLSNVGRPERMSEDSERALFPLRAEHGLSKARVDGGQKQQSMQTSSVERDGSDQDLDNGIHFTREYTVVRE